MFTSRGSSQGIVKKQLDPDLDSDFWPDPDPESMNMLKYGDF